MMMRRSLLTLFLLSLMSLSASGLTQKVQFQTSGMVTFTLTEQQYLDALTCLGCNFIYPDPSSPPVVLKVLKQGATSVTLNVRHSGWRPVNNIELQVRYVVAPKQGQTAYQTDWIAVTELRKAIFSGTNPVTDVDAALEYRIRILGTELAGAVDTNVMYDVGTADSISHPIRVAVPSVLALRINGTTTAGASRTVRFDYSGVKQNDYIRAVDQRTLLPITTSELTSVEVFTNHATGYTVDVAVARLLGPTVGTLNNTKIQFNNVVAHGHRFRGNGPTNGFVTLVRAEDYRLNVDGGEEPGTYLFEVKYTAIKN
jgi:hypothetical protein